MNILNNLPEKYNLFDRFGEDQSVLNVNGHLHSPYSFCSFDDIPQMFSMAREENVVLLGINDFFTVDGYKEFYQNALESGVFPLFNIEFIVLSGEMQQNNIRINDPVNPGRMYLSGKGLDYPVSSGKEMNEFLNSLQVESQRQIRVMVEKTDTILRKADPSLTISYVEIKIKYARELVRERHIAKALRELVYEKYHSDQERINFLAAILDKNPESINTASEAGIENDIRSALLKKGGAAFVPEDPSAFPPIEKVVSYILDAGGIPCYPVLLDGTKGDLTDFEGNWPVVHETLQKLNIHAIELIPSRNTVSRLREFVQFFSQKGYTISFGSEHNTPGVFPVEVKIEGDKQLPEDLREVAWKGACIIAAHQYLRARGEQGFLDEAGKPFSEKPEYFEKLGNAVIKSYLQLHAK